MMMGNKKKSLHQQTQSIFHFFKIENAVISYRCNGIIFYKNLYTGENLF